MIAALLIGLIDAAGVVAATDDGDPGWLLLAGPAAGIATYTALYRYYRNTDKSHAFEHETIIEAQPVTGSDQKVDEIRGTKQKSIQGNNVRSHRERVQRVQ
ncbi:hypothetical protein ACFPZL_07040 [Leucobacter soli]|uniref:Uncharacterized protein n=1 Tax=Leucobacter soli TaxID=2812850 RepID=A0A916NEK2_9MICO|nr:hypothetical protein [Leucobacter soli]CAG7597612.1 hypothetical protein LEUCIP111803_00154 [Leucobacter soli]